MLTPEVHLATPLLAAWADNDFDGFAESLDELSSRSREIVSVLTAQEGDARALEDDIADEYERLVLLVRGALALARGAVDLALDPPATRFTSRAEVIAHVAKL